MATQATLDRREERAWQGFRRMQAELTRRIRQELARDSGLSDADYEVLHALSEAPEQTMRALALRGEVGWEKSRLSHQIRRMESRGLVAREECEEDSRGAIVRLTTTGRAASATACTMYLRAIRAHLIERLTPEQLESLADISEAVLDGLSEAVPDETRVSSIPAAATHSSD